MPRRSRIDPPGALHHIIGRGIERMAIFRDDHDRDAGDVLFYLTIAGFKVPPCQESLGQIPLGFYSM